MQGPRPSHFPNIPLSVPSCQARIVGGMEKLTVFVRSHLGAAIAAAATAVVLVGGILILVLAGGGSSAPAAATAPITTSTTVVAPGAGSGAGASTGARRLGVRGQITAIEGNTWTVLSARGVPVTVEVTPNTTFGTKAKPMTASDFSVGQDVVVLGSRTGRTVTAARIAVAVAGASPSTTLPALPS